jgi:hypothetical protein
MCTFILCLSHVQIGKCLKEINFFFNFKWTAVAPLVDSFSIAFRFRKCVEPRAELTKVARTDFFYLFIENQTESTADCFCSRERQLTVSIQKKNTLQNTEQKKNRDVD